LNLVLVVFFTILGIAGLVFRVDVGVFIGFSLFPYQFSKMKINRSINNILIGIGAFIGSVYFLWTKDWLLFGLFLFSQVITFSASQYLMKDVDENTKEDLKKLK